MDREVRIVVVDDHEVVHRGLTSLLEARPGWKIVGGAHDGDSAIQVVQELEPDLVITDVSHPGLDGLQITRWITQHLPKVRVVILTMHASKQLVREILEAGGRGYVMKSDTSRDLIEAIETVLDGKLFFTQTISETLLDGFLDKPPAKGTESLLTKREIAIIGLLTRGKTNREVATELNTSLRTAETHRANIMNKLQLHSVQDLVRYAVKNKLVEL